MKNTYWILALVAILPLMSCQHRNGSILVSNGQPYARERLINSRLTDKTWLEKELEKEIVPTFQGYRSYKLSVKTGGQITVDVNPLSALQISSEKNNFRSEISTTNLIEQVKQEALTQYLDRLKKGEISPQAALAFLNSSTNSNSGNKKSTNTPYSMRNYSSPALGSFSNTDVTRAQLTEIEYLNDKKAYRDTVSRYLRELEFDDSHDANGNVLRALNFSVSMIPGKKNESYGRVKLSFKNYSSGSIDSDFYKRWVSSLEGKIATEMVSIQHRFEMGYLSEEELVRLRYETAKQGVTVRKEVKNTAELEKIITKYNSLPSKKHAYDNKNVLQALSDISNGNSMTSEEDKTATRFKLQNSKSIIFQKAQKILEHYYDASNLSKMTEDDKDCIKHALALIVLSKYTESLSKYVDISEPEKYDSLYVSFVTNDSKKEVDFIEYFKKYNVTRKPYVVNVDPKNYAQNISDLSNERNAVNLALSVQAMIPNAGVGIGAGADYLRNSEKQIDAILRKPLLVGFVEGGASFGWVLGPRYEIANDGDPTFSQIPVSHSVTATIVVPGWWSVVPFSATYCWINSKGECVKDIDTSLEPTNVTPDYNAVTNVLVTAAYNESQVPIIDPRWDSNINRRQYQLTAGKNETILIKGRNLWKNSEVFIGSQKAQKVELLPDMNGLIVSFDSVKMPSGSDDSSADADLSVITSNGNATLRNAVKIHSIKTSKSEAKFVSLVNKSVINGKEIKFKIDDKENFPKGFPTYTLRARSDVRNGWYECDDPKFQVINDLLVGTFKFKDGQNIPKSPLLLEFSLKLSLYPDIDFNDILKDNLSAVYFKDEDKESKLQLQTTKISLKASQKSKYPIIVKLPFEDKASNDLFISVYQDVFKGGDLAKNGRVVVTNDNGDTVGELQILHNKKGQIEIPAKELEKITSDAGTYSLELMNQNNKSKVPIYPKLTIAVEK